MSGKIVDVLDVRYESSDSSWQQGKNAIRNGRKQGKNLIESANGNYLLSKAAKIIVRIKEDDNIFEINMKNQIMEFYGRERISEKLANVFQTDLNNGKVYISRDKSGELKIYSI